MPHVADRYTPEHKLWFAVLDKYISEIHFSYGIKHLRHRREEFSAGGIEAICFTLDIEFGQLRKHVEGVLDRKVEQVRVIEKMEIELSSLERSPVGRFEHGDRIEFLKNEISRIKAKGVSDGSWQRIHDNDRPE